MGTYRQPGLVLDKTLGMIPEAIEDMNSKIIKDVEANRARKLKDCLLYTSPSPRD